MFENIVIRRHQTGNTSIDAGLLAEALLFYDNVHLVLDGHGFSSILREIGPDNLLTLLQHKHMKLSVITEFLGTMTNTRNGIESYKFVIAHIARTNSGQKVSKRDQFIKNVETTLGASQYSRRTSKQLLDLVKIRTFASRDVSAGELTNSARGDLFDNRFLRTGIEKILQVRVPGFDLPQDWEFRVIDNGDEFHILTDLPIERIDREYRHQNKIADKTISTAYLLTEFLDARTDVQFAAEYMAEFATDPLHSELAKMKFKELTRRRVYSDAEISAFQTMSFSNARAIRQAINSGERSFSDFLKLLERARRFREWLNDRNPDSSLINEYLRAATSDTWSEGLPYKTLRFVVATAAGFALTPLAALGVGGADAFLLDRIMKGWRPNHFVEGPLRRFVDVE